MLSAKTLGACGHGENGRGLILVGTAEVSYV